MSAGASVDRLTKIYPSGTDAPTVDARAAYAELEFGSSAPQTRPYTIVNMVATADGQGRIEGDTSELGDSADAALFATLRERVDCVMAGVRTIAIEQYNAPARTEEVRRRRTDSGLAPRPLLATISRSGEVPVAAPLFADADLNVAVFGGDPASVADAAANVVCPSVTEPADVVRALREEFGVRSLLLEGGPHLNTSFFAGELVDELFLTIAPTLVGGADAFPIVAGALPRRQSLHLIGALAGEEHLYLRYRVD